MERVPSAAVLPLVDEKPLLKRSPPVTESETAALATGLPHTSVTVVVTAEPVTLEATTALAPATTFVDQFLVAEPAVAVIFTAVPALVKAAVKATLPSASE